ncbi:superinfection immunity protein [Mesorhizobium sp. CO1-1-11]|uniref:superinfection immunity protein n=1 Tax=Mesorhizobium sp. CO1-1-11 TaxID=2876636 RepID=UPI001CCA9161|nr:superinfection immunity protein [Mesorhizobium sp. CO1-1-11]MBZ9725299.1 superinfection immunity protein [Mesorhizobium sp. CO1-1-11]
MKANRLLFATGVISAATMLMPGQARAALDDNLDAGTVAFGIFLLVVAIVYELPAIIAFLRGHPNRWLILVLCTALGGTGIVWLGCLIWAFMAMHISKDPGGSNGGESGLNLLANDVQRVRIENPSGIQRSIVQSAHLDTVDRLERLKKLLDDGVIDDAQFRRMRDLIAGGLTN